MNFNKEARRTKVPQKGNFKVIVLIYYMIQLF